jgi:hypothetical protein
MNKGANKSSFIHGLGELLHFYTNKVETILVVVEVFNALHG